MIAKKRENTLSRQNLADYLEDWARGLRQGQLEVEGATWSVPEEVEAKLHLKEKKGRLVLKLKCTWETLPEYKLEAREPVVRWQESFKTLKKRLGSHFKELQQAVLQGKFPEAQVLADFAVQSFGEWDGIYLDDFHIALPQQVLDAGNGVFAFTREDRPSGRLLLALYNVTPVPQAITIKDQPSLTDHTNWHDLVSDTQIDTILPFVKLQPYQFMWLVEK